MRISNRRRNFRLFFFSGENLERVMGIEPTSSAWKAEALPLCYTRGKRGAESGSALTISIHGGFSSPEPAKLFFCAVTKNEIARRLDFPFPLLRPRKHGIKYRCRRTHPHFVQTSVYSGPVGRLFRLYDVSRLELEHAGGVVVSGRAEPQPPSRHVDVAQGPRHQRNP